jgi:ribulose-phosphate 3-epimerase
MELPVTRQPTTRRRPKLAASLLCANAVRLDDDLAHLHEAAIDYLHVDMADGHFVPLLGIGIEEAKRVRRATPIPLDVHLLVSNPEVWVPRVLEELQPAVVTFQAEATAHGYRLAQTIRQHGALAGVGINPGTPLSAIECLLHAVDLVLVMTTNPGFTRQTLIPEMISKLADLRRLAESKGRDLHVSADGNVSFENAPAMVAAGADWLVCGSSSVFEESLGGIVAATNAFRRLFEDVPCGERAPTEDAAAVAPHRSALQFGECARRVVGEIRDVLEQIDAAEAERLVDELCAARRVFIFAVGRVLMSLECLGKRLNHLGIECQVVGAMDEKPIGAQDLMLIASGSGESKLPAEIARLAKGRGARLALVTSASESTIKTLSDVVVHLPCPTKKEPHRGVASIQLMSTLFDQSLHVFGDVLAIAIQDRKHLSHAEVWGRHANLE